MGGCDHLGTDPYPHLPSYADRVFAVFAPELLLKGSGWGILSVAIQVYICDSCECAVIPEELYRALQNHQGSAVTLEDQMKKSSFRPQGHKETNRGVDYVLCDLCSIKVCNLCGESRRLSEMQKTGARLEEEYACKTCYETLSAAKWEELTKTMKVCRFNK